MRKTDSQKYTKVDSRRRSENVENLTTATDETEKKDCLSASTAELDENAVQLRTCNEPGSWEKLTARPAGLKMAARCTSDCRTCRHLALGAPTERLNPTLGDCIEPENRRNLSRLSRNPR